MTKTLDVAEVKRDIKTMRDPELMEKYGFSATDLREFFDIFLKAVAAGNPSFEWDQNGSSPRFARGSALLQE